MVMPKAHRDTAWDLSAEEWSETQGLLRVMKSRLDRTHGPAGWNVGWNVGSVDGHSIKHAHCHLIPRFQDETDAGRGIRWLFKQPENVRPTKPD